MRDFIAHQKRRFSAATLALLASAACSTTSGAGKGNGAPSPPDWVTGRTPTEEGCIFAVGTSGPTFDPEDARRYAQDDARAQLATTLSARVQALVVDVQTTSGGWSDSANVISAQQWATDTVVNGAEILATWIDELGLHGRRGTAYALGRLNLRNPVVRKTPPPIPPPPDEKKAGQVRMNAEKAFEALEAEEAKRASAGK